VLRRADNVVIRHVPKMFGGEGWLTVYIGQQSYRLRKMHSGEASKLLNTQHQYPLAITTVRGRTYWAFQGKYYWENDGLDAGAVYALLVTRQQRETQRIDRAQQTVAVGSQPRRAAPRGAIPDDLKHFVWTRDGGRCRNCSRNTELQFDHIIPVALGGATTAENLQVLCGPCNRMKSAGITIRR
jgi:hypothetical protein